MAQMNLLVCFRVHEMKIFAFVVQILKFNLVENGSLHKFLGTKLVVHDGSVAQVPHFSLHRPALVSWRAVIDAEDGIQLTVVTDNHARAKLCGFDHA
jgi:hypothetical protein